MKKSIIVLGKRVHLSSEVNNGELERVVTMAHSVVQNHLDSLGLTNYSRDNTHSNELKSRLDIAVKTHCLNVFYDLKGKIPGLYDCSGRVQLKMPLLNGQIPDVSIEVVEFVKGENNKIQLAVYFETESFVLLDSIGDKLLLAMPNEHGEDEYEQTFFEHTFFLHLTDDLYFKEYKTLVQGKKISTFKQR